MSNRTRDYIALRDEFVRGNMSLRELCRMHDITNHSPVAEKARNESWADLRVQFRAKADRATDAKAADRQGERRVRAMEVMDHAFDAVDDVLQAMRRDLAATVVVERKDKTGATVFVDEPVIRVTPAVAAQLIDRLQTLVGNPSRISEERVTGDVSLSGVPVDLLRAMADAARGASPRAAGGSPVPRITSPRPTN